MCLWHIPMNMFLHTRSNKNANYNYHRGDYITQIKNKGKHRILWARRWIKLRPEKSETD